MCTVISYSLKILGPKYSLPYLSYLLPETAGQVANSVDPDQMPHSVAFDLGLHRLLGPVHPIT